MVAAVERATGVTATVAGKPNQAMVDLVDRSAPVPERYGWWGTGPRPIWSWQSRRGGCRLRSSPGVSATPYPEADLVVADLAEFADRLAADR